MAQSFGPSGFRPTRHVTGQGQRADRYLLDPNLAYQITYGDLVKSDGNGGITRCNPGDAMLGVFGGWYIPTLTMGKMNLTSPDGAQIPFRKVWIPGTVLPAGQMAYAFVHDDPLETFEVQCSGSLTAANIGALCNLGPAVGNTLYGISRQMITAPGTSDGPISAIAVSSGGSSYENAPAVTVTRHANDPYVGMDAEVTVTLDTAAVDAFVIGSGGFYSAAYPPTITLDHTGGGGSGAAAGTITLTPVTASQFRIKKIIEKQVRLVDANNNSTGWGLSGTGAFAYAEVQPAKHEALGSALAVAV